MVSTAAASTVSDAAAAVAAAGATTATVSMAALLEAETGAAADQFKAAMLRQDSTVW
jgi:hypothetical protein